jgi:hypothetical protein
MLSIEHLRCHMACGLGLDLPCYSIKRQENTKKLSNDILDHMTMDIGEAEITSLVAVSQLAMVDS